MTNYTTTLIKTTQGANGHIQRIQIKGRSDVFAILNTVFKEQQYTEVEKQKIMLSTIFKISQSELTYKEATEAIYYMLLKKGLVPAEQNDIRLRENDLKFVEAMILYCRDKNYVFNKGNRMYVTNFGVKHMKKLIESIKAADKANKKHSAKEVEAPSYEVVSTLNEVNILDVDGQLTFDMDQLAKLPVNVTKVDTELAAFLGGQVVTEEVEAEPQVTTVLPAAQQFITIDTDIMNSSDAELYDFYKETETKSNDGESLATAIQTEAIKDVQVTTTMSDSEFELGFNTFAHIFARGLNDKQVEEHSNDVQGDTFKKTLAYAIEHGYIIKQDPFGLNVFTYTLTPEGKVLLGF